MAKRKTNKQTSLIIDLIVIALGVLVVCTLFMPVLKTTVASSLVGAGTSSATTGADIITALFKGEASSDLTTGANALVALKNSDENGFVAVMLCIFYFVTVLGGAGVAVFAVLDLVGLRFKLINTVLGIALFLASVIALVFAFVVAGKYGALDLGVLAKASTKVNVGGYMLIGGVLASLAALYKAKN